jgi:hypothetical protein
MKKSSAKKRAARVTALPVRRKKAGSVKAGQSVTGRVTGIAVDPSDPSGNTVALTPINPLKG